MGNMAILQLKQGKSEFLPVNIRNKEGRYMLVVYALGAFLILVNLNVEVYIHLGDWESPWVSLGGCPMGILLHNNYVAGI